MQNSKDFESAFVSCRQPIDVLVGKRIRTRRVEKSLSQRALADALGLTFQQLQKYEKGANRVSCSQLWQIARILDAPIPYFFNEEEESFETRVAEQLDARDLKNGKRLAAAFAKISDFGTRRKFLNLLECIASYREVARP